MTYERLSRLWAVIIMIVMVFFLWMSKDLKFGAAYPRIIGTTIILLGLATIILSLKQEKKDKESGVEYATLKRNEKEKITIAMVIGVPFILLTLWESLSFMGSAFLCLVILFLYQKETLIRSIAVAAMVVVALQSVFGNAFQVPLPTPNWWPGF